MMAEGRILHGTRPRRAIWLAAALLGAMVLSGVAVAAAGAQSDRDLEAREAKNVREYIIAEEATDPGKNPEGVVYDRMTKSYFTGGSTDGAIMRGRLDERRAEVFLSAAETGLTGVYGVNVDGEGRLYVASGSQGFLDVYDIESKELIVRFAPGGAGFINDMEIAPNGDVYFTDSFEPFIYRASAQQVEDGDGSIVPVTDIDRFTLTPEVDYTEGGFNANGIRFTSNGRFIIFSDINGHKLYRMTPTKNPERREIREIQVNRPVRDPDGLEFLNSDTLYAVNNMDDLIYKLELSPNYLKAEVLSRTTSSEFHTPTAASLAPDNRLLVANAEFFDTSEPGPPFYVTRVRRP